MGVIRKSLFALTLGAVRPESKKQRVARKIEANTRATELAVHMAAVEAEQRAQTEHLFRYDTDPTYRDWVDRQALAARRHYQRRALEKPARKQRRKLGAIASGDPDRGIVGHGIYVSPAGEGAIGLVCWSQDGIFLGNAMIADWQELQYVTTATPQMPTSSRSVLVLHLRSGEAREVEFAMPPAALQRSSYPLVAWQSPPQIGT